MILAKSLFLFPKILPNTSLFHTRILFGRSSKGSLPLLASREELSSNGRSIGQAKGEISLYLSKTMTIQLENERKGLESLLSIGSSRQEGRMLSYYAMPQLQRCRDAGDKILVRLVNLLPTSLAAQGQYVNTWRVQGRWSLLLCL